MPIYIKRNEIRRDSHDENLPRLRTIVVFADRFGVTCLNNFLSIPPLSMKLTINSGELIVIKIKEKDSLSGILIKLIKHKNAQILFVFSGILSVVWISFRVLTKPSRASYPCIRAAFPIASSFILYVSSLAASFLSYKYAGKYARKARHGMALLFICVALITGFYAFQTNQEPVYANISNAYVENSPIGEPQGVMPGRVVWFHDPGATDEYWHKNKSNFFFASNHTNIDTVEAMINASILELTGTSSINQAWDSLFTYFNKKHGKGSTSYQENEQIFIKCNFVAAGDQKFKGRPNWTTPQVILVILRHLINNMSIPQENIALGDPMNCVIDDYWDILHSEYPDVKYIDHSGGNGRTFAEKGAQADIYYSDKGEILREGDSDSWSNAESGDSVFTDTLYTIIENADYMINIAALKAHERAGVSLCAKNHFGSHTRTTAKQQHMGLVRPNGSDDDVTRYGYRKYRILVDLMGHRMLGGNTLLFMVDGLWAAPGAGSRPEKFRSAPFNNDWTSSVFMSQDQVALESVCLDFLQAEFTNGHPQIEGVDDYLIQAADPTQWPENFVYDPENDGTSLTSLGVHEHWNNATDKQYSVELGIGNGIDFVKLTRANITSVNEYTDYAVHATEFTLSQNYPNPFNPSTTIGYTLKKSVKVSLKIFNIYGQEVEILVNDIKNAGQHEVVWRPNALPSGMYFYRLQAGEFSETKKLLLQK